MSAETADSVDLGAVLGHACADEGRRRERGEALLLDLRSAPTVLVGAGGMGARMGNALLESGVAVVAFADANPAQQERRLLGVPVMSHEEAAERWGEQGRFVVTIWNGAHSFVDTRRRLSAIGCGCVVSWLDVARVLQQDLLPQYAADVPETVLRAREEILALQRVWADTLSASVYASQITWRLTGDFAVLGDAQPDHYFPSDAVRLRREEVFVDCGAFTGDTVLEFARRMPEFGAIYAFEPDEQNFVALAAAVRTLSVSQRERIFLYKSATGVDRGVCRFASGMGAASSTVVGADGRSVSEVPCTSIDGLLEHTLPTFIKLDVEGAEAATLRGAAGTLTKGRPVLAVAAYHNPADVWELPALVSQLTRDYLLYLQSA